MGNSINIEVTLGSQTYKAGITGVRCYSCFLPGINRASIVIPVKALKNLEAGDPVEVVLSLGDNKQTVLKGDVKGISSGIHFTTITAGDNSAIISAYRPAVTYQKQSVAGIIQAIAGDCSVSAKTITGSLKLASYAACQERTGGEHIAYLSQLSGCVAFVDTTNDLNVITWPSGTANAVLSYGRDILSYRTWQRKVQQATPYAIGNGPAGSVDAPDVLKQAKDFLPQTIDLPGTKARWKANTLLKTPQTALSASTALQDEQNRAHNTIDILCILSPQLRPGMIISLQGIPGDTTWIVSSVIHEVHAPFHAQTRISCVTSKAGGLL